MSEVNAAAQSSSEKVQTKVCHEYGHKLQLFILKDGEKGTIMCNACGQTLEQIRGERQ